MDRRLRLLPPVALGAFLLFVVFIHQVAVQMEEQVAVRTAVSTVNLLKWVQLYPDTLFVVLDGITILALMAFVYSVAWYLDGRR